MGSTLHIDLSGLFCPQVVLEAARTVRANPDVDCFEVVSTDPLSVLDIPVYALRNGLEVAASEQRDGRCRFLLKRAQGAPAAAGDAAT